ncbi:MAG: hypothetical protein BWX48_02182 [Verrucomicrobia bacterium ADurb.Bin006]|nr:MAG: hypothetical protein BWX48_02182 [Verrucomicrobia bacterium ADurb.Bin006]
MPFTISNSLAEQASHTRQDLYRQEEPVSGAKLRRGCRSSGLAPHPELITPGLLTLMLKSTLGYLAFGHPFSINPRLHPFRTQR